MAAWPLDGGLISQKEFRMKKKRIGKAQASYRAADQTPSTEVFRLVGAAQKTNRHARRRDAKLEKATSKGN